MASQLAAIGRFGLFLFRILGALRPSRAQFADTVRQFYTVGARSVPIGSLTDGGRLKDAEALRTLFSNAGIDPEQPVVTSCGSGVTAAAINFALASLHNRNVRLYDGSWTEWGSRDDTPVETGPAR